MSNIDDPQRDASLASTQSTVTRQRRPWRWVFRIVVVAMTVAALAAGSALWALRSEPDYWTANQRAMAARTPAQTQAMANRLEADLRQWLDAVGRGVPSPARRQIAFEDLNAWMATHGVDALRRLGAPGVDRLRDPMVGVEGGKLVLAGEVRVKEMGQVLSLVMATDLRPAGMVHLRVAEVRGGNLPLPKASANGTIAAMREEAAQEQQALIDQLTGPGRLCDPQPVLSLFGATRNVRLDHLAFDAKGLEVGVRAADTTPPTAAVGR